MTFLHPERRAHARACALAMQAIKRLIGAVQRLYPTVPSRSVDFETVADPGRGVSGAGSTKLALLEAEAKGEVRRLLSEGASACMAQLLWQSGQGTGEAPGRKPPGGLWLPAALTSAFAASGRERLLWLCRGSRCRQPWGVSSPHTRRPKRVWVRVGA